MVHPSFAGSITLELANIGDTPITLYPGLRVAQLALHFAGPGDMGTELLPSKYSGLTGPVVTSIQDDPDWEIIERWRKGE